MSEDVRLIAFYLPQYHPIAENDAWWGAGYTEWTRVVEGRPQFEGHHQPQLPGALGFYDLRLPEAREAQVRLALQYGIQGFCYYHYWFNGRRLLERPFAQMLACEQPQFPFCVCWANENWTRRWDGRSDDILIAQQHSPEDDRAMIRDLLPAFAHRSYIRVKGRPLVLVYRTRLLPDPAQTAAVWRQEARAAGVPDLYLCRVECFDDPTPAQDPSRIGFDAACEFPPHRIRPVPPRPPVTGLRSDFQGLLYDYAEVARDFAVRPQPPYRRFHGVMPAWDNTARVGPRAHIAVNATPEAYRGWLEATVERTRREFAGDERLVFINAWNEWGEGCHLEPDSRFGLAWLEATRDSLGCQRTPKRHSRASVEKADSTGDDLEQLATQLGLETREPQTLVQMIGAHVSTLRARISDRDALIAGLKDRLIRGATLSAAEPSQPSEHRRSSTDVEVARAVANAPPIRIVCATRADRDAFFSSTALGKSLTLYRPQAVEVRLFPQNIQGLPAVYNAAIEECSGNDTILLFVHDDVHLCDFNWADRLRDGLRAFDVIGLAGNRRRVPGQAGWMYLDERRTRDTRDNLSGIVGHGRGYCAENVSVWGPPGARVVLLDGLFFAVRSTVIAAKSLRFDERFDFHFYDVDFCRQAEQAGLAMGTWPISAIHESVGNFTSDEWHRGYETYLEKWGQ